MAWASKTYSFSASTTIASAEVNQNFDDVVNGLNTAMPSGAIVLWSGSIASIPSGWYLCNGSNGTPDLRDKFIVGAGSTYAVAGTGGATTHTHTFSDTSSYESATAGVSGYESGSEVADHNHTHSVSGTTGSGSSLPPYYALAYIMKS